MASPLKSGKPSVNLAAKKGAPGSRIRRDPPPVVKKTVVPDRDEYDRRAVAIGITSFALAIVAIILGVSSYGGWTPSNVTVSVKSDGAL